MNLTRYNGAHQKKAESIFAVELEVGTQPGDVAAASGSYLLGRLPANCLVENAYIFTKEVSDAATSAAATLGTAEGGTQLMTAGNLKALGKTGTAAAMQDTGAGKELWLNLTFTGATTAVGKFMVVLKYLEYTKTTGELTRL